MKTRYNPHTGELDYISSGGGGGEDVDGKIAALREEMTSADTALESEISGTGERLTKINDNLTRYIVQVGNELTSAELNFSTRITTTNNNLTGFIATKGQNSGIAPLNEKGVVDEVYLPKNILHRVCDYHLNFVKCGATHYENTTIVSNPNDYDLQAVNCMLVNVKDMWFEEEKEEIPIEYKVLKEQVYNGYVEIYAEFDFKIPPQRSMRIRISRWDEELPAHISFHAYNKLLPQPIEAEVVSE